MAGRLHSLRFRLCCFLLRPLRVQSLPLFQEGSFRHFEDVPHGVVEPLPVGFAWHARGWKWLHLVTLINAWYTNPIPQNLRRRNTQSMIDAIDRRAMLV